MLHYSAQRYMELGWSLSMTDSDLDILAQSSEIANEMIKGKFATKLIGHNR